MAKNEGTKIGDIDIARAVIAHEAVHCFVGTEQKKSAQPEGPVSCTGGTFFAKAGEKWPVDVDGQPLIPWLQIVCTEMKQLHGAFHQKKCVCFYIKEDYTDDSATSEIDRGDFVVREYALADKLVPLDRPPALKGHPFHQVIWEAVADYPSLSKYYPLFDRTVYDLLREDKKLKYKNRSGIKIGGWPTPIQRGQEYPGSYDLQIDMTENFMYGDSGVAYLNRNGGRWHVTFECC